MRPENVSTKSRKRVNPRSKGRGGPCTEQTQTNQWSRRSVCVVWISQLVIVGESVDAPRKRREKDGNRKKAALC